MTVRGPGELAVRERRRVPRPQVESGRAAYSMLLGLSALLLVGAISLRQLTEPEVSQQLMAEGIAALTEIDAVLETHRAELDALVAETPEGELVEVPGFPLPVRFTPDEYASSSEQEFRDLVLKRGASLVYEDGLSAFDEGGASISLFSMEGLLDWLVGMLSDRNNTRAGWAAAFLGVIVAIASVMVVVRSSGFARIRALGVPLLLAALAGLAINAVTGAVVGRWWGGDPFSDQVDAIISDTVAIGRTNYVVLGALGLGLVLGGLLFELIARAAFREPEDAPEY